jgi:glycosyltransferase involved in cell wall biosynthesis
MNIKISVCICTRKRKDGLKRLLESIEAMIIPSGVELNIIIVENDSENFTESVVRQFAESSRFKIDYFLETKQGIVFARNRSVAEAGNCDFCCFTDDDEIVAPDWIEELVKCQNEFGADAVAGPTMPSFTKKLPVYITSFHQPNNYPYGTIVGSAFTGNLLVRKKYLDMLEGPFEPRLNFSGGEDSYLTKQIIKNGGVIRFNPNALASETVPEARTTVKYILRRKFRTANTELIIRSINDKNFTKLKAFPRLVLRFMNGLFLLLPYLVFGKAEKLKGLTKMANAVGGFAFVFGKKTQFYR